MRRWLAIFLLILLPAQLSWAAVGDYCAHESGAGAEHFGHHEHRHTGDDGDMEKGGLAKGGHVVDVDAEFDQEMSPGKAKSSVNTRRDWSCCPPR